MKEEKRGSVVISGGSGGLGKAAAKYFADNGYHVFSLDIKTYDDSDARITQIQTDITDSESVERAFLTVKQQTDGICAVISLAGIYFMDSLIEVPEAELKSIFDVNFFGVYRLNRIFLPLVIAGHGRIIITTSELAGMKALPFNGIYSLTKTALQHYTDSLRQELRLIDIPVIEIMPGAFDTGMINSSFASLDRMSAKTELYRTNTAKFKKIMKTQSGSAKSPRILAKTIFRAATARFPHTRYKPNNNILLKFFNVFTRRAQTDIIHALISK